MSQFASYHEDHDSATQANIGSDSYGLVLD